MRALEFIRKKRDGERLNTTEIKDFIQAYVQGQIPDYQVAAWAMAVFFRGMDPQETIDLTQAMVESGDTLDLSAIQGIKVDKHSTGGVGDKTTLILAPLVAAAGGKMAKMSGRGLGHTGGTIDKFEAIPGFRTELTSAAFMHQVNQIGAAVVGQSGNLVPADKKLYALRDVTATVESIPLIASSVMSKKIAAGADALLLDVKVGKGAFVKTQQAAFDLARILVNIGEGLGRKTIALITNMDQPLGKAVGNSLEVQEAAEILHNRGPHDLRDLCIDLGAYLLLLSDLVPDVQEGRKQTSALLESGAAVKKFKELVQAQGGDPKFLEDYSRLPTAAKIIPVCSRQKGYVQEIQAEEIGLASGLLGASRETQEDSVDLAVGIVLNKKIGDEVKSGEPLAFLHVNQEKMLNAVQAKVEKAFKLSAQQSQQLPAIYGVVQAGQEEYFANPDSE